MKLHRQLFIATFVMPASLSIASCSQPESTESEAVAALGEASETVQAAAAEGTGASLTATEAVAQYGGTNGFLDDAAFDAALDVFSEVDVVADGLGPVYNAQSCRECHQNPVVGAGAQFTELRAGHFNGISFVDHPGGSLVNDRAINVAAQEKILAGNEVRTFRIALSLLGDGYVEAIDSNTIAAIAASQPAAQRGTLIQVPVLEAGGIIRAGRFGIKNQQASLLSFAADAYVNEIGVTSPLQPTENTSNGNSVAQFDTVADPEDDGGDIQIFTDFMRSLPAPPRGPITAAVTRGQTAFNAVGCATCHVGSITTAPAGTSINGGAFVVPAALGDKTIHPFGDFLLHDIGTGDGIVQNGGQGTRNQVRTAPLWGLRARDRMMHDGLSVTRSDAIARHAGQAQASQNAFNNLSTATKNDILAFLDSL